MQKYNKSALNYNNHTESGKICVQKYQQRETISLIFQQGAVSILLKIKS